MKKPEDDFQRKVKYGIAVGSITVGLSMAFGLFDRMPNKANTENRISVVAPAVQIEQHPQPEPHAGALIFSDRPQRPEQYPEQLIFRTQPSPPDWVTLDSQRYPCPEGLVRQYMEINPGLWKTSCEVEQ